MCCYQLRDIPLDLSHPITGSLASQYLTSSVIGGGPIYSVKMLRSTALGREFDHAGKSNEAAREVRVIVEVTVAVEQGVVNPNKYPAPAGEGDLYSTRCHQVWPGTGR